MTQICTKYLWHISHSASFLDLGPASFYRPSLLSGIPRFEHPPCGREQQVDEQSCAEKRRGQEHRKTMHLEERVVKSKRIPGEHGHCPCKDAQGDCPRFFLQHGKDKDRPGRRAPPTDLLRHDIHTVPERIIMRGCVLGNRGDPVNEGQYIGQPRDKG